MISWRSKPVQKSDNDEQDHILKLFCIVMFKRSYQMTSWRSKDEGLNTKVR